MGLKPVYFACKHGIPEYDTCEECGEKINPTLFKDVIWDNLRREGGQYTVIDAQDSIIVQKAQEQNDSK